MIDQHRAFFYYLNQQLFNNPEAIRKPNSELNLNGTYFLPIINISYSLKIVNCFCNITLTQQFLNDTGQNISDFYYSIPSDPQFCLSKMIVQFENKNPITAKIRQLKQAEKAYQNFVEGKTQNQNVILANINSSSKSIIEIRIGKLSIKEKVKITLEMITELEPYINDQWILRIPSYIGPKWSIEKQTSIYHQNYIWSKKSFQVEVNASYDIIQVDCQKLIQTNAQPRKRTYFVDYDYLDQQSDFILIYKHANFGQIQGSLGNQCLVLTLFQRSELKRSNKNSQIYFVVDRSGSMANDDRLPQAKKAMEYLLQSLPQPIKQTKKTNQSQQSIKFNIIQFGSDFQKFRQNCIPNNDINISAAKQWVKSIEAHGGTNIHSPLKKIFEQVQQIVKIKPIEKHTPRNIIILTDGDVENIDEVCKVIRNLRNKYKVYVHFIGIGESKNSVQLIKQGSEMGEGGHIMVYQKNENELKAQMVSMLDRVTGDLIRLTINYSNDIFTETFPKINANLGRIIRNKGVLNLYFRFNYSLEEIKQVNDIQFFVNFEDIHRGYTMNDIFDMNNLVEGGILWDDTFWKYSAFKEISHLERQQNPNYPQLIKKSIDFGVLFRGTAMIVEVVNQRNKLLGGATKTVVIKINQQMTLRDFKESILKQMVANIQKYDIEFQDQARNRVNEYIIFNSILIKNIQYSIQIVVYNQKSARIKGINGKNINQQINIKVLEKIDKKKEEKPILNPQSGVIVTPNNYKNNLQFIYDHFKHQLLGEFQTNGKIPYNKAILQYYNLLPTFQHNLIKLPDYDDAMTLTIYEYIRIRCRGGMRELKMIMAKMLKFLNYKQIVVGEHNFDSKHKHINIEISKYSQYALVRKQFNGQLLAVTTIMPLSPINHSISLKINTKVANYQYSIGLATLDFILDNKSISSYDKMAKDTFWIHQSSKSKSAMAYSVDNNLSSYPINWLIQQDQILVIFQNQQSNLIELYIQGKQGKKKFIFKRIFYYSPPLYPIIMMSQQGQSVQIFQFKQKQTYIL